MLWGIQTGVERARLEASTLYPVLTGSRFFSFKMIIQNKYLEKKDLKLMFNEVQEKRLKEN